MNTKKKGRNVMKRILALLLAGVLLLSLASCVSNNGDEETGEPTDTTNTNTDTNTDTSTTGGEDSTEPEDSIKWEETDETVYTFKAVNLRADVNGESLKSLDSELALHRTRVSEAWSYVEVTIDGEKLEGYISNKYITTVNILGTDFVTIEGGKTMYAISESGVNVRKYPTVSDFSTVVKTIAKDTEVKAVAKNDNWFKIEDTTEDETTPVYYYISAKLLSETKGGASSSVPS